MCVKGCCNPGCKLHTTSWLWCFRGVWTEKRGRSFGRSVSQVMHVCVGSSLASASRQVVVPVCWRPRGSKAVNDISVAKVGLTATNNTHRSGSSFHDHQPLDNKYAPKLWFHDHHVLSIGVAGRVGSSTTHARTQQHSHHFWSFGAQPLCEEHSVRGPACTAVLLL